MGNNPVSSVDPDGGVDGDPENEYRILENGDFERRERLKTVEIKGRYVSLHQAYANKMGRGEDPFAGPRGGAIQSWQVSKVYGYSWNKDNPFQNAIYEGVTFYAYGEVGGVIIKGLWNLGKGAYLSKFAAKGGSQGFSEMMEAGEAARYAKYWESYAPKQISPGTTRLDWLRVSGRTGQMESSRVIYDTYGRQIYRVDFSSHMRPLSHSVPHLHQYEYGPMSTFGKESVFNFFGK